jgi:hypothetical protein
MRTVADVGQELGSMYDYLAKIILLGPSGSGKYAISSSLCSKASTDKHQILSAAPICER